MRFKQWLKLGLNVPIVLTWIKGVVVLSRWEENFFHSALKLLPHKPISNTNANSMAA